MCRCRPIPPGRQTPARSPDGSGARQASAGAGAPALFGGGRIDAEAADVPARVRPGPAASAPLSPAPPAACAADLGRPRQLRRGETHRGAGREGHGRAAVRGTDVGPGHGPARQVEGLFESRALTRPWL